MVEDVPIIKCLVVLEAQGLSNGIPDVKSPAEVEDSIVSSGDSGSVRHWNGQT